MDIDSIMKTTKLAFCVVAIICLVASVQKNKSSSFFTVLCSASVLFGAFISGMTFKFDGPKPWAALVASGDWGMAFISGFATLAMILFLGLVLLSNVAKLAK